MNDINSVNNITNTLYKTQVQKQASDTDSISKKFEYLKNSGDDKKLMEACQEFESIFVHMLLKEMRATIPEDGLVEKSMATKIFEDMYDEEVAKKISQTNGGLGIAKMLYEQMKRR